MSMIQFRTEIGASRVEDYPLAKQVTHVKCVFIDL